MADWDCDGTPTPVVLRLATGEVWAFARWAREGEDLRGRLWGRVRGAVAATEVGGDGDGGGCAAVEVTDAAGVTTVVNPP